MRGLLAGMVVLLGGVSMADSAWAGTIEVDARNSYAEFDIFAGSFGATERIQVNDQLTTLAGAFAFARAGVVDVVDADPFSRGDATTSGSLSVSDNVFQPNASSLRVEGMRSAVSQSESIQNGAVGFAKLQQILVVDFSVLGSDAYYKISGSFDDGADRNNTNFSAGRLSLNQRNSPNTLFSYTTASLLSASGWLTAGTSYRLELRMTDDMAVGAGNTLESDTSHVNFLFTVSPVPEPSSALMFGVGLVALLAHRRRRAGKQSPAH
jgi:hypothetical protein